MREAPYLSTEQIENIIESELRKARMMPTPSHPVLDLDAFITCHLKCGYDPYADLPSDVMGEVCFPPGKKPCISINRDLSEEADLGLKVWVTGRQRATTAHEASHVILHKDLFSTNQEQGTLFSVGDAESEEPKVHRCFKSYLGQIGKDLWKLSSGDFPSQNIQNIEIQANKGMSAMLLPKPVFLPFVMPIVEMMRGNAPAQHIAAEREALISHICDTFQVSRQFASVRIRAMKLQSLIGQEKMALFFNS